jgi:glycosyltransferase involved in cell wall biosynthesis
VIDVSSNSYIDTRSDKQQSPIHRKLAPAVALLLGREVFEDEFDTLGVSLDEYEFWTEDGGGWAFGYIEALYKIGVRTVVVVWSREARKPYRRFYQQRSMAVWVLPATRTHRVARWVAGHFRKRTGRVARFLWLVARFFGHYTATPPRALARVLHHEQCGAIITQTYEYPRFDICVLFSWWLGLPVFATFQGGLPPKNRMLRWIRRRTVPNAAGLLIGSQREAADVTRRYRLPSDIVTYVPNAINQHVWTPGDQMSARAALNLPVGVPVVCWNGRVDIWQKGLDVLVEAWQLICAERPGADLRLLLLGTGPDSARLRRLIAAAGLRGVHWHSEFVLDTSVVRRHLVAADVYVLPSRHEGFAVAPLEAMACGCPVVACNAEGVTDLLGDGEGAGGLVVPREDPEALVKALSRLLDDRALATRLGEAARRRAVERFSTEAVGPVLASALHKATPDRFPAPPSPH